MHCLVRCNVFAVVLMGMQVFQDVMLCCWVSVSQCFVRSCCPLNYSPHETMSHPRRLESSYAVFIFVWKTWLSCKILAVKCDEYMYSKLWGTHSSECSGFDRGPQVFQKSRSYFKIIGTGRVTYSKFHTDGPQILGITIQNLVTQVT
jgi:hypothetical protein